MDDEAWRPKQTEPHTWQQVVAQLSTALVVMDPAGMILAANPAAEQLLGRSARALRGQDAHELLHRDMAGRKIPREQCPLLQTLAEGIAAHGDGDTYLRGDGRLLTISWSSSPLTHEGVVSGMALVVTNAAIERSAEQKRVAYTRALEDLTERLTLVSDVTYILEQAHETREALSRLGRLLVPRLADWAVVDLRVAPGEVQRVTVTGPEGWKAPHGYRGKRVPQSDGSDRSSLARVLSGGGPVLENRLDVTAESVSPLAALHGGFLRAVGATCAVSVPLGVEGRVTGVLTLVRTAPERPFESDDLQVASDIGRRVGLAIDNAHRFEQQRAVAESLQHNLLTRLPRFGRLQLAARYQSAPAGSQVGGDWYDAFELKDGTIALVIGDVVGHDLTAAAGMAQLHGILRSLAWDHPGPPGAVVDRLDDAMPAITTVSLATLVLAKVTGHPHDGPWALQWANAGHPPPLLLTRDGRAQYLEGGQGLLLGTGLGPQESRPSAVRPLPPGCTLLMYTDGLVEVPGSDLDTGLGRLRDHALALVHEPLDVLCDQLLARMPVGNSDDVALLAVRLPLRPV